VKIKTSDTAFSRCVRSANEYKCEKCKAQHDKSSCGLHCSHIFTRSHRTIRWCKENAQSLCFSCHNWFGGEPAESGVWIRGLLGDEAIGLLIEKKNSRVKVSKLEEKEITKHYRQQLKEIEQKRLDGVTGYIDFVSYQ
jgi:hypothetical protein